MTNAAVRLNGVLHRYRRTLVLAACAVTLAGVALATMDPPPAAEDVPAGVEQQSTSADGGRVSPTLFGAHAPWNDLGNFTVLNGELIRDRSFRLGTRFWRSVVAGAGTLAFSQAPGAPDASNLRTYPGHAILTAKADKTLACAYQRLHDRISPGEYTLEFSSRGERTNPSLLVVLVDPAYARLAGEVFEATEVGRWQRHIATLKVNKAAPEADLGLCVASPGTALIDEVRLYRAGAAPAIDPAVKQRVLELGIRSLRWPGGSDVNTLDWTQTIGALRMRGEQSLIYGGFQTPSFGLHEFLDLSETLTVAPVIVVNVLDTPARAAALIEYVLGDPASPQGTIRAGNGRRQPWRFATRFQIGNEPTKEYGDAGRLAEAGAKYAERATAMAAAMNGAAKSTGQRIEISAVAEGAMQLADWLSPSGNDVTAMLYNWNAQAFRGGPGRPGVSAAHAHYYTYFGHSPDRRRQFENLMASGEVLRRTLEEKVRPFTGTLPIWITEYQVLVESKGVVQASFTKDFQSGLVVADILMTLIKQGVPVAHIHNLSEVGAFGLIARRDAGWYLRPAARVFSLFSATAGERTVELQLSARGVAGPHRFDRGAGNIPRGLAYERVSGIATLDGKTGRPRLFLLNRDYSATADVTVRMPGYALTTGVAHWYQHVDLAAHNDGQNHDTVTVRTEKVRGSSPWSISLPPRTLLRIDFD